MNNYEKFKNMSVNEMAKTFNRKICEECPYYKDMNFDKWEYCDATTCWLNIKKGYCKQWLLEECEE